MTTRVIFKVDSVHANSQHIDYERDEKKVPIKTKPIIAKTATVSLSAVDPGHDPDRKHPNSLVWKHRASGRLMLSDVEESFAANLSAGQELALDISFVEPVAEASAA
jgi:hypothetical protein